MPTINSSIVKRLGIYCFYDKNGYAASFIPTFLDGLMPHLSDLIVIVNGKLSDTSRAMFRKYTSNIILRENNGLDAAAYRQVMLQVGWADLQRYDEVICLNDTIMGPVFPFSEMFKTMDAKDLDFWGITTYNEEMMGDELIPTHLQAYWHAYRRSLIESKQFQTYWEDFPALNDYEAVTHQHEIPFTKHFADLGFKWDSYIDCARYADEATYPLLFMPTTLVREQRCPIFKRRSFFLDYSFAFGQTSGESAMDLYDYLRGKTEYDTDLVWDTLLHSYNLADLHKSMHLNYVLPTKISHQKIDVMPQRSAFIFHVYFLDQLGQTLHYLRSLPETTSLFITTSAEKIESIKEFFRINGFTRQVDFIEVQNRGRDVSALLVAAKPVVTSGKYDVVGFAHDKKSGQNLEKGHHGSETHGFTYKLLENTLGSREYVENILALFQENPRLGMATPPPPIHGLYFAHTIPTDWGANFENTKLLLEKRIGVKVPLNQQKPTLSAIGSCYWFRVKALLPLFEADWTYEDFLTEGEMQEDGTVSHAIERANGYVAQSQGYYPAWILNDRYARIEIDSLWYTTSELVGAFGPHRQGESLLELELWGDQKIGGVRGKFGRLLGRAHGELKKKTPNTVQKLPKQMQSVIYNLIWGPVDIYRRVRHTVGGIVHGRSRNELDPQIKKKIHTAVIGKKE